MNRKLFVGNLSFSTEEPALEALFAQAGSVSSVRVMRDQATGRARALSLWMALGLFAVAGVGFAGCAGGQSGTEGLCGDDGQRDVNPFATESLDEDGGADDPDSGQKELVADDGPEIQNAPAQCFSNGDED